MDLSEILPSKKNKSVSNHKFIDTEYLIAIFNSSTKNNTFLNLKGRTSILIPTFLTLKRIGTNKSKSIEYKEEKAKEAAFLLHIPYLSHENHPSSSYLINPFDSNLVDKSKEYKWRKMSLKDYVSLGKNGIVNNYVGGGTQWDSIMDTKTKTPIRFNVNYIRAIKELCGITYTNRINITKLSAWCFREKEFDSDYSNNELTNQVIEEFLGFFNINNQELKELFEITGETLKFHSTLPNLEKVRKTCFNLNDKIDDNSAFINFPDIRFNRRRTFMSKNPTIEKILDILARQKQIILYGPPGVGKTYLAKKIGETDIFDNDNVEFIQFHQNYGYEHFIGGYFPSQRENGENKIGITYKDGILLDLAEKANNDQILLIIDEINRGNISKIFGETILCLDRDYKDVLIKSHPENKKLSLPENLNIVGTMNSTDRSIALVDFAIRRRFAFIRLVPDVKVIRDFFSGKTKIKAFTGEFDIIDVFTRINEKIRNHPALGEDYQLGHTYFFLNQGGSDITLDHFELQFNYSILPLIEEYSYGNQSIIDEILGKELIKRLHGESLMTAILNYLE